MQLPTQQVGAAAGDSAFLASFAGAAHPAGPWAFE